MSNQDDLICPHCYARLTLSYPSHHTTLTSLLDGLQRIIRCPTCGRDWTRPRGLVVDHETLLRLINKNGEHDEP